MRINTGQRPVAGDNGRLLSPPYPKPLSGYRCVEFWYSLSDSFGIFTAGAQFYDDFGQLLPTSTVRSYTVSLYEKFTVVVMMMMMMMMMIITDVNMQD